MSTESTALTPRLVTKGMRRLALIISGLVFGAAFLLVFFPTQTDRFFAWTINPPMTAAFLGAAYAASFVSEFLAGRERIWVRTRIVWPSMLVFTGLTLLATLIHLDRFHFDSPIVTARFLAWAWIIIYIIAPLLVILQFFLLSRTSGSNPPRQAPLSAWFRLVYGTQSAFMVLLGAALFLSPDTVSGLWPWKLTALTGQAVGAWLLGIGLSSLHAIWENDWTRIQIAMISDLLVALFELLTLLRFPGDLDWSAVRTWVYVFFLISMLAVSAYGLYARRQVMRLVYPNPLPTP